MIHGKPFLGYLVVQISIAHRRAFQLSAQRLTAAVRHIVLNRLINEPAALAGLRYPIDGLDC